MTRTPVRIVRPCFLKTLSAARETSRSMVGRMRSMYSRTMTSAPRRCQTTPSSSPITPPPTTMSLFGTSGKERASVEVTTRS